MNGSGTSFLVIVLATAGAALLIKHLSLEPAEIEARARNLRGGLIEYYHRRKTKRDMILLAIGVLGFVFLPSVPRILVIAFGIYALIVVIRLIFRPKYPAVYGGLNMPPQPNHLNRHHPVPPPVAPAPTVKPDFAAAGNPGRQPNPGFQPRPIVPPQFPPNFPARPYATLGSTFATVGIVAATLALGAGLFFVSMERRVEYVSNDEGDGPVRVGMRRIPEIPHRLRRVAQVRVNNQAITVQPASGAKPATFGDFELTTPKQLAEMDWTKAVGKKVAIVSEKHKEAKECEDEVMQSVVDLLPTALQQVHADAGDEISEWKPNKESLDELLTGLAAHEDSSALENGKPGKRVKVILDMSQEKMQKIYDRFLTDRSTDRSYKLARAYAGAVLLLGGVSILLRIGTGRKPTRPTAK